VAGCAPAPPDQHLRFGCLQAASSRSSTTTDPTCDAHTGPLPRRSAATRSEPSTRHHVRPAPHCTTHAQTEGDSTEAPRPHVLLRPSVVKLSVCARASASAPTSPIWLSASGCEHPILQYDARHHYAPSEGDPAAASRLEAQHHALHATRTAPHAKTESDSTEAQATRTAETKRRQTRGQCACQSLNGRISDFVACERRVAGPKPRCNVRCTLRCPP
jgi:hypothetical protein